MNRVIHVCMAAHLLAAVGALAATKAPTGYGKATFGMTYDKVRKLYPKAEVVDNNSTWGAAGLRTENQKRLGLYKQSVLNLPKPVDVELRFWKDKLWVVIVYLGENDPKKVAEALTKAYGPPTSDSPQYEMSQWNTDKVITVAEFKQRRYSSTDAAMSKDAQEWFITELKKRGGGVQPSTSAPPAAGPNAAQEQKAPAESTPSGSTAAPGAPAAKSGDAGGTAAPPPPDKVKPHAQ